MRVNKNQQFANCLYDTVIVVGLTDYCGNGNSANTSFGISFYEQLSYDNEEVQVVP